MQNIKSKKSHFISVKDIVLIALFADIIFCQEALLSFLPGVNFTYLLIAACFFCLGLSKTLIMVLVYTLIDNLIMGSFISVYTPVVILMWLLYPIMLFISDKIFIKQKRRIIPALTTAVHSILYSWAFVVVFVLFFQVPFLSYFIPDIPYEIILTLFGFITTFLFLPKLVNLIKKI